MLTRETISYLANRAGVTRQTIRDLKSLAVTWEGQTGEAAAATLRLYYGIVADRCRGIDPLDA